MTPQGRDSVEDHVISRLGLYDLCFEFACGFIEIYHLLKAKGLLDSAAAPIFSALQATLIEVYRKLVQKEELDSKSNKQGWKIKFSELIVKQANDFIAGSEKQTVGRPFNLVREVTLSSHKHFDLSQDSALPNQFIRLLHFQKTMKGDQNQLMHGSLASSAWTNYIRSEVSSPKECFRKGIIKSRRLDPLGGLADMFTAEVTEVTNAASGIICYLVAIINHSKVFLEELKIAVSCSEGLVYANGSHDTLSVGQVTALSTRRIRLNFRKTSLEPSTITLALTCSQLSAVSDNQKLKLAQLDQRPADLPDKAYLVSPWSLKVSGWRFLVPLALSALPLAGIKALEESLVFRAVGYRVAIEGGNAQLTSLEGYLKDGFTQSLVMVIDAKPKAVYFKECLNEQFAKIHRMVNVERRDMLCYLLFAAVLHGQLVGFKLAIDSCDGATTHTFVRSF